MKTIELDSVLYVVSRSVDTPTYRFIETQLQELPAVAGWPDALTPALAEVLGMMVFELSPMAHGFRVAGRHIERKAEAEQAFMLHWLVPFVLKYGDAWRKHAGAELRKVIDAAKAAEQKRPQ